VEVEGQPLRLTGKEYDILELLSLRKGTTVTKEMFLRAGGQRFSRTLK
jgi:two-component system, cell cycle response regulator CtrA